MKGTWWKGAAMGIAEVIPGVSGGTIAFVCGIYEELLRNIAAVPQALKHLFRADFKSFALSLNLPFLLQLFGGMVGGIVIGVFGITRLLESSPILVWAFFFGLILASVRLMMRQTQFNFISIIWLAAGLLLGWGVSASQAFQGSESLLFVFLSGTIAISALILPGISGSFLLLLMGMYHRIIPQVKNLLSTGSLESLWIVASFGLGCIVGLFSFARLVSFAFKNYRNSTVAAMVGLMLGSLWKIWPWQEVLSTRTNSHGEESIAFSQPILPGDFSELASNFSLGTDPQLWSSIACMVAGIALILLFEKWEKSSSSAS